jgi:hypothetical protein
MTRKNILIVIVTFIIGFGSTFYTIRTYFPKQKVEKTVQIKDSLTKTEANFSKEIIDTEILK